MKTEMSRLEQENASLLRDLGTRTGDSLLLDGLVGSLKNQVENLRAELISTHRTHREQMQASHSKLDEQWEEKMVSLKDSHSRNLENTVITCRMSHSVETLELTAEFERKKKSLEDSLVRISSEASAYSARTQRDLVSATEKLQAESDSHALSVTSLNQQIKDEREASEHRLSAELETLRAAAQTAAEEKERLACEGHDAVLSLMKDMYKKALGLSFPSCFSIFPIRDTRLWL